MGTMNHVAVVSFKDYHCRISQTSTGYIHCFKYNTRGCDWAIFTPEDQDSASEYILTPLPTHYYYVDFREDPE